MTSTPARVSRPPAAFWASSGVVVLVTMVAVALAHAMHQRLDLDALRSHAVLVILAASGLFLVSATLRWATYLVDGRSDARVRAAASVVVAVVLMPVHLWTHGLATAPTVDQVALLGAGRVLAAVLVVTMLVLAMARPRWHDRLYVVAASAWLLALALLALGVAVAWRPGAVVPLLSVLALLTAAAWGAAAAYAAHRTDTRPWARSMAPLLLLMGVTEVLVALDPRADGPGATASVILVATLAVVAVVRAFRDLRATIASEQRRAGDLQRDLLATRDDLVVLQQRERRLAHEARGTLAGVRAAMQIWAGTAEVVGRADAPGTEALRHAALREVARLEDALREHRIELGTGPVALDLVVDRAARVACARGAEIKVDVPRLVVLGQATDLELAVREIIDRCLLVDPSLRLEVSARPDRDVAVLVVRSPSRRPAVARPRATGPSVVSSGEVDDLAHAAHLLRRTGGELHRDEDADALRLVVPLCPAPPVVPRQRRAGSHPATAALGTAVAG